MNIKLKLKSPKSDLETLVLVKGYLNSKRLTYSTGIKICPDKWDFDKELPKASRTDAAQKTKRNTLVKFKADVSALISDLEYKGKLSIPHLRKKLDEYFSRRAQDDLTLFGFIDTFMQRLRDEGRAEHTIRNYRVDFNHIKAYASHKNKALDFDMIDLDFHSDLIAYLRNEKKLSENSIGKVIASLKTLLNEATEKGINKNMQFRSRHFTKPSEKTTSVYLTEKEIQNIKELDLTKENKGINTTRDIFVVCCYLGLRYSDVGKIKPEFLTNNQITVNTQKTGAKVVIPLHPTAKEILEKYNYCFEGVMLNRRTANKYLKRIAKLAGINQAISVPKKQRGMRYDTTKPKYELIGTHTARRSFATNAYLAGVPAISIMKVTGHTTEVAFLKYIKISEEQNANLLSAHPFFRAKLAVVS